MGIGRKAIISEVTIKTYPNSAIERFQDALNQRVVGLLDDRREHLSESCLRSYSHLRDAQADYVCIQQLVLTASLALEPSIGS